MEEFKIKYGANTLTIGDLKQRLTYLAERHRFGQPEEDASDSIWDEWRELETLQDLESELSWCWNEDSKTMIFEDYFDQFARQECYDLGDVKEGSVVDSYADWDKVAAAIQQGYKAVRVGPDSLTYWVRS